MGIPSVGSFPVWSGGSLIFFQLFRCRNLVLNRVFTYFLVAGMFYTWGGVWMPPHLHTTCILYTPAHAYTPGVYTHPICPHTLLCLCVFLEALHVVRGCNGLPFVFGHPPFHHPCLGVPPLNYTPTLSHWFPVHQHLRCPYAHSCTFL